MMKPVKGILIVGMVLLGGCAVVAPTEPDSPGLEQPSASNKTPSESAQGQLASPSPGYSTEIVPGERFGPVTQITTRANLAELFGEANLKDEDIPIGEGETTPGTVVNLGEERSFTVLWEDSDRTQAGAVTNPGRAWRTPEGIYVGMPFAELREKLGEFQLFGFEWDYGGTVVLENSKLSQYDGVLILRVQPSERVYESSSADLEAVAGDGLFPSSNSHMQRLELTLDEMIVSLSRNEQ